MRRTGLRFCCLLVIGLFALRAWQDGRGDSPQGEPLEAPPRIAPELAALVEKLGDESFKAREAASQQLAAKGAVAQTALLAALRHDDPEVRLRVRRLLEKVLAADHAARLKAFIDDKEGQKDHDLPGWDRYRKMVGDDGDARALFAQMQQAEPLLMETAAGGGDQAAEGLRLRCYQLLRGQYTGRAGQANLGNTAALVFACSHQRAKISDGTLMQVYQLIARGDFQKELRTAKAKHNAHVKKLVGGWVRQCTGQYSSQQAMNLAMQYGLEEGIVPARALAANTSLRGYQRMQALLMLGRFGENEDLKVLQKLLTDKAVVYSRFSIINGKRIDKSTLVCDLALALMIHLTDQKVEDYGLPSSAKPNSQGTLNASSVMFADAAARDAAMKKWKQWTEKNELKVRRKAKKQPDKPQERGQVERLGGGGIILGGGFGGIVAFPGNVPGQGEPGEVMPFYIVDRESAIRLNRARQLVESRQYRAAVRLLDDLLSREEDRSYQADFGRPIFQNLRVEAERILGTLNDEGRRAYELAVGTQARRALEQAIEAGDPEKLQAVSWRYFLTHAGQEATLLLGNHLLDVGRPLAAATVLARLHEAGAGQRFEPKLSVRLATSWLRAGLEPQARAVLEQLARAGHETIEIGARRLPPLDNTEAVLAWLRARARASHSVAASQDGDWPLFRGDAGRNAASQGDDPWLRSRWQIATVERKSSLAALQALQSAYHREQMAVLPAGHLLAAGDVVLARNTGEVLALDPASGEMKWRVPFHDAADEFVGARNARQPVAITNELYRGLDERLWGDATYGTLASDGRFVFLVEDVGFAYGLGGERMIVNPDGSRRLDAGWPQDYNRLTAYDVRTGKFQWEIGGPRAMVELSSPGVYFLGPPLPLGGRLYVVGEIDRQLHLFTLDAKTGRERSRRLLGGLDPPDPRMQMQFMYGYNNMPDRSPRRMCGASPSFGGGVLVCPIASDGFVAVDLVTQSILWSYRPMDAELPDPRFGGLVLGLPIAQASLKEPGHRDARWADCSATVVGDRVLLTPRTTEKLFCLELRSGRLVWEAPRLDSQYVAGVHEGTIMLVGRGTVRGLKLADGRPAWEPLKLPPAGVPSGRGYLAGGRYYLPLATAEVAVVDAASGRLLKRSKSRDGRVPGNLICYKNHVVSQGIERIEAFDRLDTAVANVVARLRDAPDDPALLAEHGEILSFSGRYAEAIAQLRRSLKLRAEPNTRTLLCETALEALRSNFAAYVAMVESLKGEFEQAGQLPGYYRWTAYGQRQAGQRMKAFETYLKLADLTDKAREMEAVETALSARRDRWLQGELANLYAAGSAADRVQMDRAVRDRLAKTVAGKDPPTLRLFINHFSHHAAAEEAREALVRLVFDHKTGKVIGPKRRPLRVQQYLLQQQASSNAARSRAATARLARMMAAANRPEAAAVFYRRLQHDYADVACLDGKTGQQLVDALPADSPTRRALRPADPWPTGAVETQTNNTSRSVSRRLWPLNVESARNDVFDDLQLQLTTGTSPQKVEARDAQGGQRWSVDLKSPDGSSTSTSANYVRARTDGHLMVVWQYNRVLALDTLAAGGQRPAVLWGKDMTTQFPGMTTSTIVRTQMIVIAGGVPVFRGVDPFGLTPAELGPVNGRVVCYQRMRHLTAVDPYSGETLWTRHDVPRGCELLGDDHVIMAIPAGSTEARVFRASDGQEITRCKVPPQRDRVANVGRFVVTWTGDDQGRSLRAIDPSAGENLWQRDFPGAARIWRVTQQEIAVLDPRGRFVILRLPDGKPMLETDVQLDREVLDIIVLRSHDRYLLLAKQTPDAAGPADVRIYPVSMGGRPELVSGTLYGFDRRSGKLVWKSKVNQQGLDVSQPSDLPVLVFGVRVYDRTNSKSRYTTTIRCLDKRNGREVLKATPAQSVSSLQATADVGKNTVDIFGSRFSAKLTFTDKK